MKHRLRYAPLLALLAVLPGGCEAEVSGFLSCGSEVCGPRQECVAADEGVACACLSGYVGEACDLCAFGHRRTLEGGCELIPIDCVENPEVCGDHGQCTTDSAGDYCSCGAIYEGRLCERCVAGQQDNDLDGTCEASCSTADLECELPTRCSDADGAPRCVCPIGYVGERCEQCAVGYRDDNGTCVLTCEAADLECGPREECDDSGSAPQCVCREGYSGAACEGCDADYHRDEASGACLPGCDLAELDCGEHGQCSDALGFAACQCDLAYAGELCDRCAAGYALAAGDTCRFSPPPTHTLLADVMMFGQSELKALDPTSGEVLAVGEQSVAGLAEGVDSATVFALSGQTVSLLDLADGERIEVVSGLTAQAALAFDAPRQRLYALGSVPESALLWVDPAAGSVAPQGDTGLGPVRDLAYDALSDRVLALGEGLWAVDPSTAAVTALPDPPPATRGIAFAADGTLYALAATDLAPADARIDACRQTAAGLGLLGYEMAPGSVVEPSVDDATLALDSLQPSAVEVVAYLGRGLDAERRTLTITSDNAEAVLCLELREPTTIAIPAAASFRAIVAYSAHSDVEVDIDDEFVFDPAVPLIHLGALVPSFSYPTLGLVREYTPDEWQALRLPIDPYFYAPGPGVLHVLDAAFVSTSTVLLPEGVRPFGTLTAWAPAP